MISFDTLIPVLSKLDGVSGGVTLAIVGMIIVFCGLSVIALIIMGINRLLAEKAPDPIPVKSVTPTPASEGITPEIIAVLTAAATAAMQTKVRIRHITVMGQRGGQAWVAGGRMSVMGSHKPHLRKPRG